MKPWIYGELDEVTLEWFNEQRTRGTSVSRTVCMKQAVLLCKKNGSKFQYLGQLMQFKQ
jgi:hypothetical protein